MSEHGNFKLHYCVKLEQNFTLTFPPSFVNFFALQRRLLVNPLLQMNVLMFEIVRFA